MSKKLAINSQAPAYAISKLEPFDTYGAMFGHCGRRYLHSRVGWLKGDGLAAYERDMDTIDYTVVSYATPIAWHTPERGWVVVDRNFSQSSSKHQAAARWGVSLSSDDRVEYVMIDYRLSGAQWALLDTLHETAEPHTHISGAQLRTARALESKGLIHMSTSTDPGAFVLISEKGIKVFS